MSYFFRNKIASRTMGVLPWTTAAAVVVTTSTTFLFFMNDKNENDNRDNVTTTLTTTTAATATPPARTGTLMQYQTPFSNNRRTYCDAAVQQVPRTMQQQMVQEEEEVTKTTPPLTQKIRPGGQMLLTGPSTVPKAALDTEEEEVSEEVEYHNLFPLRQLFVPAVEYPLWDENWDERATIIPPPPPPQSSSSSDTHSEDHHRKYIRQLRKNGVTRHIILIRHGQYDESHKEDETRILTPLGREQAHMTGKRIAEMIQGAEETFGSPCHVKALRVSNLTRAKETASIIASYLPSTVSVIEPDPMLNEGRPCHTIPGGRMSRKDIETTDAHHPRIEGAFRNYIHRAPVPTHVSQPDMVQSYTATPSSPPECKHEFEIIVCHANVIRYIMCRSLQLPPEAWLRFCPFNCSLTYLTIRPTGTVSCRMIGDIGHLPYSASTFSGHHGYNW